MHGGAKKDKQIWNEAIKNCKDIKFKNPRMRKTCHKNMYNKLLQQKANELNMTIDEYQKTIDSLPELPVPELDNTDKQKEEQSKENETRNAEEINNSNDNNEERARKLKEERDKKQQEERERLQKEKKEREKKQQEERMLLQKEKEERDKKEREEMERLKIQRELEKARQENEDKAIIHFNKARFNEMLNVINENTDVFENDTFNKEKWNRFLDNNIKFKTKISVYNIRIDDIQGLNDLNNKLMNQYVEKTIKLYDADADVFLENVINILDSDDDSKINMEEFINKADTYKKLFDLIFLTILIGMEDSDMKKFGEEYKSLDDNQSKAMLFYKKTIVNEDKSSFTLNDLKNMYKKGIIDNTNTPNVFKNEINNNINIIIDTIQGQPLDYEDILNKWDNVKDTNQLLYNKKTKEEETIITNSIKNIFDRLQYYGAIKDNINIDKNVILDKYLYIYSDFLFESSRDSEDKIDLTEFQNKFIENEYIKNIKKNHGDNILKKKILLIHYMIYIMKKQKKKKLYKMVVQGKKNTIKRKKTQ